MEYTIIAGVNGSGKSTLYHSSNLDISKMGIRSNVDELIQNEYDNKWNDNEIQIQAGRQIINQIKYCISEKKSFNQESTLSGRTIIQTIKNAKKQGFKICLHYIGLDSVDMSIERVKNRADNGGHDIDEATLRKRYPKSLENLKDVLPLCDYFYIYDNSKNIELIMKVKDGEVKFLKDIIPEYLKEILSPYIKEKQNEISKKTMNWDNWKKEISNFKSSSSDAKQPINHNISKDER